jgi:DNA-binding LacI/PurR family transcriptional regulator
MARRITGILTSDLSEEYGALLTSELLQASLNREIQVRCYPVPTPQSAADLFNSLSPGEDGHGYVLFTEGPVMQFLNHVLLGRGCRTISVEALELDAPYSYVMTDSRAVVSIGMEHLLSLGHRRIVLFVHSEPNHPTVHVKIKRFREMVAEHGLEREARVFTWHDVPGAAHLDEKQLMASMMEGLWSQRAQKPTAIFSVVDLGAWAAMDWLWRQGIDVPGEVSVLGFENLVTSQYTRPALTTVAHPMKQIAARAIEALWAEPYDPHLHELVAPHLVVRESTGPAPS